MGRPPPTNPPPRPPEAEPQQVTAPADPAPAPPEASSPEIPLQPIPVSRVVKGESDELLAARASQGDAEAFEGLVGRYERVVFNLTLRMTGNWQDARELTQDVFVRAWRGLHGFDTRLRFFSWIYRIAIHACLNHRRSSSRREPLEWEPESKDRGPDGQVEARELEGKVQEALDRLPAGDRQLLILRHLLDHSLEEIADALGIPAMRVKSRLFTARQRLRRELEQRGVRP